MFWPPDAIYADTDRFHALQDLVNIFGHLFGEVVPFELRKLGRK